MSVLACGLLLLTGFSKPPVVRLQGTSSARNADNGIQVGQTKIYDQRMLVQQFASYQRALSGFSPMFNQSAISNALANVQGTNADLSQFQVSASLSVPGSGGGTLPAKSYGATTGGGSGSSSSGSSGGSSGSSSGGSSSGSSSSGSGGSSSSSSGGSASAAPSATQAAGIPYGSALSGISPGSVALGAEDTLAEQTELQFQVLNLQLLLSGSISDRVFNSGVREGNIPYSARPRQQSVVGFSISVQPRYKDAVAEVTIKIYPDKNFTKNDYDSSEGDAPSLVSLLPQQKTYNVASYTNSTSGFSLGTVFQFLGVSAAGTHSSSNLYMARDVDTVAFQGPAPKGKDPLTFGWQFRPVLNQSTVQPGLRQVYAAVSLPNSAYGTNAAIRQLSYIGKVEATTVWRHYDRKTGIVGNPISEETSVELNDLDAYPDDQVETALEPHVSDYEVSDAGGGAVAVTLNGFNFFDGTGVCVGGVPLPSYCFVRPSETHLTFITTASQLINGFKITGPYGETSPIALYDQSKVFPYAWKIDMQHSYLIPVDMNDERVHIVLVRKDGLGGPLSDSALTEKMNERSAGGSGTDSGSQLASELQTQVPDNNVTMPLKGAGQGRFESSSNGGLVKSGNLNSEAFDRLHITAPIVIAAGNWVSGLSDKPMAYSTDGSSIVLECELPADVIRTNRYLRVERLGFHLNDAPIFRPALGDDFSVVSAALVSDARFPTTGDTTKPDYSHIDLVILGANLDGTAGGSGTSPTPQKNYVTVVANGLTLSGSDAVSNPATNQGVLRFQLSTAQAQTLNSIIVFRNNGLPKTIPVSPVAPVGTAVIIATKVNSGDDILCPVLGTNLNQITGVTFNGAPLTWSYSPITGKALVHLTKDVTGAVDKGTVTPRTLLFSVTDGTVVPLVLPINGSPNPVAVAAFSVSTLSAPQSMEGDYTVTGSNLDQVVRVTAGNTQLKWLYDPDKQHGVMGLTKAITAKPGPVDLTFTLKDGSKPTHQLVVVPKKGSTTTKKASVKKGKSKT